MKRRKRRNRGRRRLWRGLLTKEIRKRNSSGRRRRASLADRKTLGHTHSRLEKRCPQRRNISQLTHLYALYGWKSIRAVRGVSKNRLVGRLVSSYKSSTSHASLCSADQRCCCLICLSMRVESISTPPKLSSKRARYVLFSNSSDVNTSSNHKALVAWLLMLFCCLHRNHPRDLHGVSNVSSDVLDFLHLLGFVESVDV